MTRTLSKNAQRAVFALPADIPAALDELGIDYRIQGDEAVGLCPNPEHDDRSPSWSCNIRTGRHLCFSCRFKGSFTGLVATVRGLRVDEADLWVRSHRVLHPSDDDEEPAQGRPERSVSEADLWECEDPPAEELDRRRISLDAAKTLGILWHPRKARWIFPIRHPETNRLLGWQEKTGHRFMNRPRDVKKGASLFGFAALKATGPDGTAIVVESPLDAARFLTAGIPRAVSTYGIEFSDEQIYALWGWCDEIVFAPDNDVAGHRKMARWIPANPYHRNKMRVFDYGGCFEDELRRCVHPVGDGRDPGDLTDRELRRGVEWASPAWLTYFEGINWWDS